jgi:hypothetical protein
MSNLFSPSVDTVRILARDHARGGADVGPFLRAAGPSADRCLARLGKLGFQRFEIEPGPRVSELGILQAELDLIAAVR